MKLYHGSSVIVEKPRIFTNRNYKDFGYGFYCTVIEKQAKRWVITKGNAHIVNIYDYDIVEGPMADDTIWNYVEDFVKDNISRTAFWELVKFIYPTHQIVFCTEAALKQISYEGSYSL